VGNGGLQIAETSFEWRAYEANTWPCHRIPKYYVQNLKRNEFVNRLAVWLFNILEGF